MIGKFNLYHRSGNKTRPHLLLCWIKCISQKIFSVFRNLSTTELSVEMVHKDVKYLGDWGQTSLKKWKSNLKSWKRFPWAVQKHSEIGVSLAEKNSSKFLNPPSSNAKCTKAFCRLLPHKKLSMEILQSCDVAKDGWWEICCKWHRADCKSTGLRVIILFFLFPERYKRMHARHGTHVDYIRVL